MAKEKNVIAPEEEVTELVVRDVKPLNMAELGNFDSYEASIKKQVAKAKRIKLTETNLDEVQKVKKSMVSLRRKTESIQKEWLVRNINSQKDMALAKFASILTLINASETTVDAQLEIYYSERREQLKTIYNMYIEEFNAMHKFSEEELEKNICLKESYFNKTVKEKEVYADLLVQFNTYKKEKDEKAETLTAIHKAVENTVLNADTFIEKLQYKSAVAILNEIQEEKERLLEIVAPEEVIVPEVVPSKKEATKHKDIRMSYKESQSSMIEAFFKSNNITVKNL